MVDADGAIVATPAVDTLKVVENNCIVGTPDRRVFWNAQTRRFPQRCIARSCIRSARWIRGHRRRLLD
ncbi:MAG: 2-C-methyl-D-erythritol 4-phosphate cytidylyltransferase [Eggerthellaceae bacterium]